MLLCACTREEPLRAASIAKRSFGKTPTQEDVDVYTITNTRGSEAQIITYGARVVSFKTAGRDGQFADILLDFDPAERYLNRAEDVQARAEAKDSSAKPHRATWTM